MLKAVKIWIFPSLLAFFASCSQEEFARAPEYKTSQSDEDPNEDKVEKKSKSKKKDHSDEIDESDNPSDGNEEKVESACVNRPDPDSIKFFLLGGQSNAVALKELVLLEALQTEFESIFESGNIQIGKYAAGGTNLANQWAGNGTNSSTGDGPHYKAFQNTIAQRQTQLANDFTDKKIELMGMFWMQGESDSQINAMATAYEANLTNLIEDVRLTYETKNLPFVIGRLSLNQSKISAAHLDRLRKAQDAVGEKDEFAVTVPLDDAQISGDKIHFTAAGYVKMAESFSQGIKPLLFPGLEDGQEFCD